MRGGQVSDHALCYLSANEARSLFRKHQLSPVELLDALIAQHEAVDSSINAFSSVRFDQAREQANTAEKIYMQRSATPRLLEGIPADGEGCNFDTVTPWLMTLPFNMLSRCPVLNVPTGFAANGMPTGKQIVGQTYDDISVFQVGANYEAATHWDHVRPKIAMNT